MKQLLNICLIEDSIIVRDLLAFTIERNIDCIVHSLELFDILKQVKSISADVIILDYSLNRDHEQLSSVELLEEFENKLPDIPVIIFSGQTDISIANQLIQKGAVDYVSKNSKTFHEDIIQSLQKVVQLRKLSLLKKNQKKIRHNHLSKVLSLSIIILVLLGLILTY